MGFPRVGKGENYCPRSRAEIASGWSTAVVLKCYQHATRCSELFPFGPLEKCSFADFEPRTPVTYEYRRGEAPASYRAQFPPYALLRDSKKTTRVMISVWGGRLNISHRAVAVQRYRPGRWEREEQGKRDDDLANTQEPSWSWDASLPEKRVTHRRTLEEG